MSTLAFWNKQSNFPPSQPLPWKPQKQHFLGFHGNHNQKKKFLCSFHKTKYNKRLMKKLGQTEEYFPRKIVRNCQIWIELICSKCCHVMQGVNAVSFLGNSDRFRHRRLPVNFTKFLRIAFLKNTSRWLLLSVISRQYDECRSFLGEKSASTPCIIQKHLLLINPFHVAGLFLYPLETSEKLWFSNAFREFRKKPVVCYELTQNINSFMTEAPII